MLWRLTKDTPFQTPDWRGNERRFVLHRHQDSAGPHLDLRIETPAYLLGWRVDGDALSCACLAMEKGPHPLRWLDEHGAMERVDAGIYQLLERTERSRTFLMKGREGVWRLRAEAEPLFPLSVYGAIREVIAQHGVRPADAAKLVEDGILARSRAVQRLSGLGRELDGDAFEIAAWRRMLDGLSLEEIQAHLRAYEVRFDRRYPPSPVSRPERLPDAEEQGEDEAVALARRIASE